jgi:hypothetical protein
MTPGKGGSEQHIPQAVLEALDSVVAPSVRDALLHSALEEYSEAELPRDPARLRDFTHGPLRRALVQGLGEELAETLTEEIGRMLDLAAPSSESPRRASRSSGQLRAVATPPRRSQPPPRSRTPSPVPPRRSQSPRPATLRSLAARGLTPPPYSGQVSRPAPRFDADDAPELEVSEVLGDIDFEDLPGLTESAPPVDDPLADSERARSLADLFPPSTKQPASSGAPGSRKLTLGSSSHGSSPGSRHPDDVKTPPWSSAEYPSAMARSIGMSGALPSSRPGQQRSLPHVLVATRDPAMLRRITVWLDPRAAVMRVRSVIDLLHRIEDAAHARSVIVLDCRQPSMRPAALAALADELPVSTHVVLVAATPDLMSKLADIAPSTSSWLALSGTARPKEIAARCVELVS